MTECKHRWEQIWDGAYSCNRCKGYAYSEQKQSLTYHNPGYSVADIKPNYTISFHDDKHKRVGHFDFNGGVMHFEGEVTESGKIFVDWVCNAFKQRIDDAVAVERGYKDGAYKERNQLVALLSTCFPSGKAKTAIEGWDESWHGCVYIDFPWGQASWHYHDSDAWMFEHLPQYEGAWDGHTTEQKYADIAAAVKARAE